MATAADIRTIAGDVASGVLCYFDRLPAIWGKFSVGVTGEVIMRFQGFCIATIQQLAKMGVEFDKNPGTPTSPLPAAMTALLKGHEREVQRTTAKQSKTFTGCHRICVTGWKTLRTVGQPIFDKLTYGLSSLLDFLDSPVVKGAIDTFSGVG